MSTTHNYFEGSSIQAETGRASFLLIGTMMVECGAEFLSCGLDFRR